eukprot:2995391-Prorocentrum_lima.AAC.1
MVVNTPLAPCAAGLLVLGLRAFVLPPKLLDGDGMCNGFLAGPVAITAGCAVMKPWQPIIIGVIGGFVYSGVSFRS